jgi:hypothetical protein
MIFALSSVTNLVSAAPPVVSARCNISCTVAEIAEWSDAGFPAINLPHLTQNKQAANNTSFVLYTNGEVKITADNSDEIQLSKDNLHKLVTEYELEYDDTYNIDKTGSTVARSQRNSLLNIGSMETQVSGDDAVEVILSVVASKNTPQPGDSGMYTATHTLTVCWKS